VCVRPRRCTAAFLVLINSAFFACNLPIRRPLIIESTLLVAQEEASRDCMYSITDYGTTSTLAKSPDFLESIKVQSSEEADIAYGYVWS